MRSIILALDGARIEMPDKYILMRKSQLNIKAQGTNFRVFGRFDHIAIRIRYQYSV